MSIGLGFNFFALEIGYSKVEIRNWGNQAIGYRRWAMGNGTVHRQKNGRRWILAGMKGVRAGYGLWATGYRKGMRGERG